MILPRQVRSGFTPVRPCAPPRPARKPEITSSKISSAPLLVADVAQPAKKSRGRRHEAHVAGNGFDDHRGDRARIRGEHVLDRREIVVARDQRVAGGRGSDTGAGRRPEREHPRSRLHEERVGVPVIAAFELDDLVAPCRRARDADRAHRRLGTRADEPDALERGHQPPDPRGELHFERARRPVAGAEPAGRSQRFDEPAGSVTVNQRSPRHHVIDERVAVDIHQPAA